MKRALIAALYVAGFAACDSSTLFKHAEQQAPVPAAHAKAPEAKETASTIHPNIALAARVKRALESQAKILAAGIDVTAADGAVALWGTAATAEERDRASRVAGKIAGVKSVQNKMAVVKGS